jgi:hypothetical protein
LARAAGKVLPLDWVEVYEAHTPSEWAHQVALSIVDPWGDDRGDMRMKAHALAVITPCEETIENLDYLALHEQSEPVGPATMRKVIEG